ncbi:retrovirus-related pol polyprotein from transposon TNT 1-94 [Tanacetum coccineum]
MTWGTTSLGLPFVEEVITPTGNYPICGDTEVLSPIKCNDGLVHYRLFPKQLYEEFDRHQADAFFAFQLRNPVHNGHAPLCEQSLSELPSSVQPESTRKAQPFNDIMESVISCETAKATWTDLVHRFEAPSYTKENRIMDMKLEYQTFRAKPSKSLSQTYTRYKTLLNDLTNNGVTLFKHKFNDFQENSDDEADERSNEEYLKDLELEFMVRVMEENGRIQEELKLKGRKNSRGEVLAESAQSSESSIDTCVGFDDELSIGKNHARNGEWIDITMKKGHIREPIWYMDSGCSRR